MQQQSVGSDQQDLEEHEQVEQIAGQKSTVDTHQLELEERMEIAPQPIIAAQGVKDRAASKHGGDQQHQRRETVNHQHDAERRHPVARRIDANPLTCLTHQNQRQWNLQYGRTQRQAAFDRHLAAGNQQQQRAHKHRQHNGQDGEMIHTLSPLPSTWSLPNSPWPRKASTRAKAVIAKPITMAVSTKA